MNNLKMTSLVFCLVLGLASPLLGQNAANNQERTSGSALTGQQQTSGQRSPVKVEPISVGPLAPALNPGTFAGHCQYHTFGFQPFLRCPIFNATPNTVVFLAASEYATDPEVDRFIGDANALTIHNIASTWGEVDFSLDTAW